MSEYFSPILHRIRSRRNRCVASDLIDDVRKNIEGILNSRLTIFSDYLLRSDPRLEKGYLDNSIVNFGIADIQGLNIGDDSQEKRFCESVRLAISRFEPRMTNVRVELVNILNSRMVNLEVRGSLVIQPFKNKNVTFESGLDLEAQEFVVE